MTACWSSGWQVRYIVIRAEDEVDLVVHVMCRHGFLLGVNFCVGLAGSPAGWWVPFPTSAVRGEKKPCAAS